MKTHQLNLTSVPVTELNVEEKTKTVGGIGPAAVPAGVALKWALVTGTIAAGAAIREAYNWGRNLGRERARGDRGNGGSCPPPKK